MIDHLDHLVLTTFNEDACVDFYTRVMGMTLRLVLVWASALVHGLGLASSLQAIGLDF